jgi:hypothetical protein
MFRTLLALPFLLLAYACLQVAFWVCPSLKETGNSPAGAWLDAPEGWDKRVN